MLTLTKNENKLSQIAYDDLNGNENKAFWSQKKKQKLIGLGEFWMKSHYAARLQTTTSLLLKAMRPDEKRRSLFFLLELTPSFLAARGSRLACSNFAKIKNKNK